MRSEVPAGHVDEVARALDRIRDRRERLGAVDQDVHRAARTWWRIAGRPQTVVGWRKRTTGSQTPKPPAVLGTHDGLNSVSD